MDFTHIIGGASMYQLITVLTKTQISVATVAAGNTVILPLGLRTYNMLNARSGRLCVRMSADPLNTMPVGSTFSVALINAMISSDEPNTLFPEIGPGSSPLASVSIPQTDVASWPLLYTNPFTTGGGVMGAVGLTVHPSGANSGQVIITLGVELVLRDT